MNQYECDCGFFEGERGDCICNKRYTKVINYG